MGYTEVTATVMLAVGGIVALAAATSQSGAVPPQATVLAPGAKVEKLAGDFTFTEGPTSDKEGNVYFVDQPNNRIMKYDVAGRLTTFMQPSGYANGMTFDNRGLLIACADEKNEMWAIDVTTRQVTPLFNKFEGKLLNGPNDVWVHPKTGRMYFTDPYYERKWWNRGPKELTEDVYVYSPDEPADRRLRRVVNDMEKPNGIIGTPDGKTLYVADSRGRKTFAYDIAEDGSLTNKRLFCEFGSDGMTIDSDDNVYLTTEKAVVVFDRSGRRIETIAVPEVPANVCFGGKDSKTLFITARTGFYSVRTRVNGVGPQ